MYKATVYKAQDHLLFSLIFNDLIQKRKFFFLGNMKSDVPNVYEAKIECRK